MTITQLWRKNVGLVVVAVLSIVGYVLVITPFTPLWLSMIGSAGYGWWLGSVIHPYMEDRG